MLNNPFIPPNAISVIAAPTGSRLYPMGYGHKDSQHPYFEIDPRKIATELKNFFEQGLASQAHLHARNPATGAPTGNPAHYAELMKALKATYPDAYYSITMTDANMPQADKDAHGELKARSAVLYIPEEEKQPSAVPIIDALSISLIDNGSLGRAQLAADLEAHQQQVLHILAARNIGFEIEIPNYDLIEVAKMFIARVGKMIENNPSLKNTSVERSLQQPVFQLLFGARDNMPPTAEHLEKVVQEVTDAFNPRAIQVGFRDVGDKKDCFNSEFTGHILDLAGQRKITGIRIGIEDTFLGENGKKVSTHILLEHVKDLAQERGLEIATPEQALRCLTSPYKQNTQGKIP